MVSRDDLKALIDQLPESRLEAVGMMLHHHLNPPPELAHPEIGRMRMRGQEFRKMVVQRFHETRKSRTISSGGGSGSLGVHEGTPYGRNGFSYWDEKAMIHQTLQAFDGQDIEIMERLEISPDRTKLYCVLEISSGSQMVHYENEFPVVLHRSE